MGRETLRMVLWVCDGGCGREQEGRHDQPPYGWQLRAAFARDGGFMDEGTLSHLRCFCAACPVDPRLTNENGHWRIPTMGELRSGKAEPPVLSEEVRAARQAYVAMTR